MNRVQELELEIEQLADQMELVTNPGEAEEMCAYIEQLSRELDRLCEENSVQ